eukprot:SAG22_NODE_2884_length_2125_cov_4.269497_2_plen_52_part_00
MAETLTHKIKIHRYGRDTYCYTDMAETLTAIQIWQRHLLLVVGIWGVLDHF